MCRREQSNCSKKRTSLPNLRRFLSDQLALMDRNLGTIGTSFPVNQLIRVIGN